MPGDNRFPKCCALRVTTAGDSGADRRKSASITVDLVGQQAVAATMNRLDTETPAAMVIRLPAYLIGEEEKPGHERSLAASVGSV